MPYITNLRLDPFERTGWPSNGTKDGAQQYFDWFKYQFWRFVFVRQVMGKDHSGDDLVSRQRRISVRFVR